MSRNLTLIPSSLYLLLGCCFLIGCSNTKEDPTPWIALFDGNSLDGWSVKGGKANYKVRDNAIVGSTVRNSPNSFLTTDKRYGDFILELEYQVDSSMNSGIQIRSNSYPYYMDGRVHGYQIEIDPSERSWSAGIYDEGRRGWLYPMTNQTEAQKAFRQNEWNHYRIEAIGDTIKTWINNVPAAYLVDDRTAEGFIALQVHSIEEGQKEGTEIIWRKVKILTDSLSIYSKKSPLKPLILTNQLTLDEEKNGWKLLWDGKSTKGWRGARLEKFRRRDG